MKKAIEIEELRISSNGKYMEFIINCPEEYEFKEFLIQVRDDDNEYSIGESLFKKNGVYDTSTDNRFLGQVPVSLFGVSGPEIYRIHLEAHYNDENDSDDDYPEILYADAYISDVSHVYDCLIDDILSLQSKCVDKEAQDRVIRNYLILYAHQEALKLGHISDASKWFDLMANCFSGICGKPGRKVNVNCGCNTKPNNCGCRK